MWILAPPPKYLYIIANVHVPPNEKVKYRQINNCFLESKRKSNINGNPMECGCCHNDINNVAEIVAMPIYWKFVSS